MGKVIEIRGVRIGEGLPKIIVPIVGRTKEEILDLPKIQLDILQNLSRYVKPGGVLLYSTCTVRGSENEGVVSAFLRDNDTFKAEAFTLPGPIGEVGDGMITLWPQCHGTDGFFICKMRKGE